MREGREERGGAEQGREETRGDGEGIKRKRINQGERATLATKMFIYV